MPISGTGSNPRPRRDGFSLVELLLVLTILSLIVSAVALTVGESRPSLTREAETLAARLTRAQEAAIVQNRLVALELDGAGYGFAIRRGGRWTPLDDAPFTQTPWEVGTRPDLPQGDDMRVAFDPTGFSEPAEIVLRRGVDSARIEIDAAGEVRRVVADDPPR